MDTMTNGRSHPRPRMGDRAAFIYQGDGNTYEGEIFIDEARRVLFAFNSPKVGIKNEINSIPYKRVVVLGDNARIREPVDWWDAQDFFLMARHDHKILYPGDSYFEPDFNKTLEVIEVIGDTILCSIRGAPQIVITTIQPSLL